jgi:hypothetical protein
MYKITYDGEVRAFTKYLEDAAMFAGAMGDGSRVFSDDNTLLWVEGSEEIPASESYDRASEIMTGREKQSTGSNV